MLLSTKFTYVINNYVLFVKFVILMYHCIVNPKRFLSINWRIFQRSGVNSYELKIFKMMLPIVAALSFCYFVNFMGLDFNQTLLHGMKGTHNIFNVESWSTYSGFGIECHAFSCNLVIKVHPSKTYGESASNYKVTETRTTM